MSNKWFSFLFIVLTIIKEGWFRGTICNLSEKTFFPPFCFSSSSLTHLIRDSRDSPFSTSCILISYNLYVVTSQAFSIFFILFICLTDLLFSIYLMSVCLFSCFLMLIASLLSTGCPCYLIFQVKKILFRLQEFM